MQFYEKLSKLRKANNLSQEQLAEKLNVTRQAVSKWESGESYPDMAKIIQLCKILNCSLNELMDDGVMGEIEPNEKENEKEEKKYGDVVFKTGDRVMQIKNNYDIFWEKEFGETGSGIFNGEMGQIEAIDDTSKALKVLFDDGKKAWYEYNELEQLEHSYSITIHKSQRK